MATDETTFELIVGGDRLVVIHADEAREIVSRLQQQVEENYASGKTILKAVDISCRVWCQDSLPILQEFFTPELVKNVTTLKADDIIASLLTDEGLAVLEGICNLFCTSPLEKVNLSDNALGTRGIAACNAVLGQQDALEELYLENNGIATASMEDLRNALQGSEHLRVIHFYNNMSGTEGAHFFADIVRSCPSLVDIRYAGVRSGREGTLAVVNALEANAALTNIQSLDLEGETFYSEDEEDCMDALVALLKRNPSITYLDIGDGSLKNEGMVRVCQALLESNPSLTYLNVSGNELEPTSCAALRDVLASNIDTLKVFKAESNEFGSSGVVRLLRAYTRDAALENLNLEETEIGHRGAVALANARPRLPNIIEVKLNGNGFPSRDVTRLQEAFGDTLASLDDNDSEAEFDEGASDEEDELVEQELAVANDEEEEEEEDEDIAALSQAMGAM